jgi:membrane complex biogenesis BtpA family protein
MQWIQDVFHTNKPIIAMCHLMALPGDPLYDTDGGMDKVVETARQELIALQEGGVDAVMFSNEFSLPYLTKVKPETVAAMARVIGELKRVIRVPYGVNCLWDPSASLDLAVAVDALFVREIFTGVYASDFGLWNTNCGEVVRHQQAVGAQKVKLLFNVVPEAAAYLAGRELESIVKTTIFNCRPDGLCVSGATAGVAVDRMLLHRAKAAAGETPVFANTGCRVDTIEALLRVDDGAVVGTAFKFEGKFENAVDSRRVSEFMDKVKSVR